MKKLWLDTETGGLDPNTHDMLTAFFAVCDDKNSIIDELYLQLKPNDVSQLRVDEAALRVNKINIQEHLSDPNTLTYEEGSKKLVQFLNKNLENGKKRSLQPCGHNVVSFDLPFLWNRLISQDAWGKIVHYRALDTIIISTFMKDIGILPPEVGSLTSLAKHYKMATSNAHHARFDVQMNIEVYNRMVSTFKDMKKGLTASTNSSLLEIIEA